ncbi:MAG: JAB domain-containing protein [bacterium]|nr:JAB domain-containing protein [bacterium]
MPTCPKSTSVPRYRLSLVREAEATYARDLLDRPEAVAEWFWREIFHDAPQEQMAAAFTDVRNRLIGYQVAYVGRLSGCALEPRGILSAGLLLNAAGFILAHNHPSGDPSPSPEDQAVTRRMAEAGEVVGVKLIDHLVLGDRGRWVSLGRRGAW